MWGEGGFDLWAGKGGVVRGEGGRERGDRGGGEERERY